MISSSLAVPSLAAINLSKPLDSFAQKSLDKRYYRSKTLRIGSLQPSSSIKKPYSLRNGVNYGFAAVCDQNCTDIDIRLIDENEQVIEEDIDSDNTAVIPYTAEADGTYEVEVIMYDCGSQLRLRFRSISEEIIMKLILALGIVLFSAIPVLAVDLKNEDTQQHTVKITEQSGITEETLEPNEEKTVCAGACQIDVEGIAVLSEK